MTDQIMPEVAIGDHQPARKRWVYVALAVALLVVVLAGGILYAARGGSGPTLDSAEKACNDGRPGTTLADGGKTLIVDMAGTTQTLAGQGGVDAATEVCLLQHLGAPAAVIQHMDSTRALDGRQTDSWGDFTAAWTYLPADGLDMTIQQR